MHGTTERGGHWQREHEQLRLPMGRVLSGAHALIQGQVPWGGYSK